MGGPGADTLRSGAMASPVRSRRILLLIPTLSAGGAESQIAHLAAGLAGLGDEVTIACLQGHEIDLAPLRDAGVRVVSLGAVRRPARALALPTLVRLARRHDVVHTALFDASLWGRLAAFAARRPVTVGEHSSSRKMQVSATGEPRERWIAAHHRALAPITYATVACAWSQFALLGGEGVPRERIVFIANGVPMAEIEAAAAAGTPTRADLGIPEGALVLAHVARLTPEKNQRQTVETVARLRAEGAGDVHALLVGDGADATAAERARALGAEGFVHFLGRRADVPALLALADLAVLPSVVDTMPMVMLEAMGAGVPLVVSDVGDLGLVVAQTGAGVVVPARDPGAFEQACRALLADPARRAALAERALATRARYDLAPMTARYSRLFDAAIAGLTPEEAGLLEEDDRPAAGVRVVA